MFPGGEREVFVEEGAVLRRFGGVSPAEPLIELEIEKGREDFEEAALGDCGSLNFLLDEVPDGIDILSSEESVVGFIDVDESLNGHEYVSSRRGRQLVFEVMYCHC
jgi:hypothetical protein